MSEGFEEFLLKAMEIHGCSFTPGNNIHINCRQQETIVSEGLPHKTLNPVSDYGTADLFACRNPKPRVCKVISLPYHQDAPGSELLGRVF